MPTGTLPSPRAARVPGGRRSISGMTGRVVAVTPPGAALQRGGRFGGA